MSLIKDIFVENVNLLNKKQEHQVGRKVIRQDNCFSTRLTYACKKRRQLFYSIVIIKFETTEDMIKKLHIVKSQSKLK